jgi:hypothetical protein
MLEGTRCERTVVRSIAAAGFALALSSLPAEAREAAVIVLRQPARGLVPEHAQRTAERVIEQTGGLTTVNDATIASRLGGKLRRSPALEPEVSEILERESGELLEAVAFGRDEEAIARGRAALRRESVRLTATNRSEANARALGDICLFVVRALMHRSDQSAARGQARECVRMIFDLDPSVSTHPPAVRTLVAEVRAEQLGRLSVTARGSLPPRCVLRIQGRRAGPIPVEVELVPGAYSLLVDCGAAGLVHEVVIHNDRIERVTVAPRLEAALRLEKPTVLHSAQGVLALRTEDLSNLAEWVAVSELWALERRGNSLAVTRWERAKDGFVPGSVISVALNPTDTLDTRLATPLEQVLCTAGRCVETKQATGAPAPTAGIVLGGLGVSLMLGSWIALKSYAELDSDLDELAFDDPRYAETHATRQAFGTVAIATAAGGSALFSLAAPLWLPRKPSIPVWGWATGAVGVSGLVAGSALWLDRNGENPRLCPEGAECGPRPSTAPLAPVLVAQGASLLSIPLTYLIRGSGFRVGAGDGRFAIELEETF